MLFLGKPAYKSTPNIVGRDLQSAANFLSDPDKEFTEEDLQHAEIYVLERVKHLRQLRKEASKTK